MLAKPCGSRITDEPASPKVSRKRKFVISAHALHALIAKKDVVTQSVQRSAAAADAGGAGKGHAMPQYDHDWQFKSSRFGC